MDCERAQSLIGGYVDNELSAEQALAISNHVSSCKECRAIAAEYRQMAHELARDGRIEPSPKLREAVARALAVESALEREVPRATPLKPIAWRQFAAALAIAALSSAATYGVVRPVDRAMPIEHDLLTAHVRSMLQDNQIQVASSDSHTVRPWFAGKLDFAPAIKDLTPAGYPLVGGRIDYVDGRRVAVAVYKRKQHWVNVFIWPTGSASSNSPDFAIRQGHNMATWQRDGFTYWAVSDLNGSELRKLESLL